jgi:hypothetical protein
MPFLLPILAAAGSAIGSAAGAVGSAAAGAGSALAGGLGSLASGAGSALGSAGSAISGALGSIPNFLGAGGGAGAGTAGAVPAAEAGLLSSLGQSVPQGVSMVGPQAGLSGAEASTMFPGGGTGAAGAFTPNRFEQLLQGAQGIGQISNLISGITGGGGGGGGGQDTPDFMQSVLPPTVQPILAAATPQDPLAFLRAFSLQA